MNIGIPFEENIYENRVSISPYGVHVLRKQNHKIYITVDSGIKSGYSNEDYKKNGAIIVQSNQELYEKADLVVKVNHPENSEIKYLKEKQIIFSFYNFFTNPTLLDTLSKKKITAIAYELIRVNGQYPIVSSMSRIAGKLSFSIASEILSKPNSGKGLLLGGSPSASRSKIVVIGGGNAGMELVRLGVSAGSRVSVFDTDVEKLNKINHEYPSVETFMPYHELLIKQLQNADVVLGATSAFKRKVPKIISNEMLKMMEPRSVFIDLTTSSGGISESTKITNLGEPIYLSNEIFHYCVPNIAATVPKTASNALTTNILKYVIKVADGYLNESEELLDAICIKDGKISNFLSFNNNEFKQKQIKDLIKVEDEDEDEDGINWKSIKDKRE